MKYGRSIELAFSSALALGLCTSSAVGEDIRPEESPREALVRTFDAAQDYWRGLGKVGTTHLVIVERGQTFTCAYDSDASVKIYGDDKAGLYCPKENAVAITAGSLENLEKYGHLKDDIARFNALHEIGHGVDQKDRGQTAEEFYGSYRGDMVAAELKATRYAGEAAAHTLTHAQVREMQEYLELGSGQADVAHGLWDAQRDAFEKGLVASR